MKENNVSFKQTRYIFLKYTLRDMHFISIFMPVKQEITVLQNNLKSINLVAVKR